ncbi:MAG TPA: 2-C-methyl-D-erythritol 4-phosphate cytidylyltransferase [Terriglobales bacterium]|nr:2-C-methyl-D-erythritol 4-phosphate cytidylyltransferase [Terriglobales bacterium]
MKVIVIIPAAGLGTRMAPVTSKGKGPSKQFTELGGTPILIHTIRKFAASSQVNEIVVALRKDEMSGFQERLRTDNTGGVSAKTRLVEGGEHRQHSVANALATISASTDDVVLVHDAVRPFVTAEIVDEVIQGAQKFGAAIAGVPAVDTIKKVERTADGALITATIPREHVVMAQTPQGFRYDVLKKAFDEAAADGFLGTDEASLVERSGHEVAVVMGSPRNIKITTPGDMELAEFYLQKYKVSA